MWSCPLRGGCPPPMVRSPIVSVVRQCSSPTRVRRQNVSVQRRFSSPTKVLPSYSPAPRRCSSPIAPRAVAAHVRRDPSTAISRSSSSASLHVPHFAFGATSKQVDCDLPQEVSRVNRIPTNSCRLRDTSPSRTPSAPSACRTRGGHVFTQSMPAGILGSTSRWGEFAPQEAYAERQSLTRAGILLQGVRDLSEDVAMLAQDPLKKAVQHYPETDDEMSSTATGMSTCDHEADSLSASFSESPIDTHVKAFSLLIALEKSEKLTFSDSGLFQLEEVNLADCDEPDAEDNLGAVAAKCEARENLRRLMSRMPSRARFDAQFDGIGAKLQQALLHAKSVGLTLDDDFVAEAERMISSWEVARATSRAALFDVLSEFKVVSLRSANLEYLRDLRDRLNQALMTARSLNLAEEEIKEIEESRRRVHNRVEDMKGQVRVFCRLRPQSQTEQDNDDPVVTYAMDDMTVAVDDRSIFGFDCVFEPGEQDEVFEDCEDLVQSAFDGFNITIFTYGQTGAGKTYTMYGDEHDEGIAGRAISEIFRLSAESASWQETHVSASIVELYNNTVADLGWYGRGASSCKPRATGGDLAGALEIPVSNQDELKALLASSIGRRAMASHALNSESSRSHLLFSINVIGVNRETHKRTVGKIILCDLAGSERLKKTEAIGARKKEAIEINKSLTALGDVIEAVSKKQKQIPYRNHKLTQILQDSIGGSAKTLMIVNCSPTLSNVPETSTSLKFAERAKKITNAIDNSY